MAGDGNVLCVRIHADKHRVLHHNSSFLKTRQVKIDIIFILSLEKKQRLNSLVICAHLHFANANLQL